MTETETETVPAGQGPSPVLTVDEAAFTCGSAAVWRSPRYATAPCPASGSDAGSWCRDASWRRGSTVSRTR